MKYLTGQALKDFKKWFYNHPEYKELRFDTGCGGCEVDELPDAMTVGLVAEWFGLLVGVDELTESVTRKLTKTGKTYNRGYVNSK